ncbi:hypothetical protein K1719_035439 [Acacia pycnantha]|nr:hypothetical protein K1719_035439 [Acacia pycnantha]
MPMLEFSPPNLLSCSMCRERNQITVMANATAISAALGKGLPPGITGTNVRCTILVSNLNPDRMDEDKLFNLFSIYGSIVGI